MYGWRARIGLMIPSTNTVAESEYHKMAPKGVSVHSARMKLVKTTVKSLTNMINKVEKASEELGTAKCNAIVFGCTSGSFFGGESLEKEIAAKIKNISHTKAVTASGAVIQALSVFGKKKVSVVTPYIEELNVLEKEFLESRGYHVIGIKGLGLDDNITIGKIGPEIPYRMAREIVTAETEIVFISCTDFRSLEIIRFLEKDLNLPVITSNQCGMWSALRKSGVNEILEEYGRLFQY